MITFGKFIILLWLFFCLAIRMVLATIFVLLSPVVYLMLELTGRDPKEFDEAYERWLYDGFRGLRRK